MSRLPSGSGVDAGDTEAARALSLRFYRAYSESDWSTLRALLDPDFRSHYQDHPDASGREEVIASARAYKQRFPDLRFEVLFIVASPEAVACWSEMCFTHTAEYLGIPATGRALRTTCVDFFTVRAGLLASRRHLKDKRAVASQLGAG